MLSTPGIGSGLDVDTIINGLLEIERAPIFRLETRKAENDVRISSYAQISNDLSSLQTVIQQLNDSTIFNQVNLSSSNESVVTVTSDSNATLENHSIEVVNLAINHRLNSNAFANQDTIVGTGTLALSSGSNNFSIDIDTSNNTLAGVRDAINSAEDNSSISASIINTDAGSTLILTAEATGLANTIEVIVSSDGDSNDTDNSGLSQLLYQEGGPSQLTQLQAADDADIRIDGFDVTSASNTVTGAISGVTLNLQAAGSAEITAAKDNSTVEEALNNLVSNYNSIVTTIQSLRDTTLSGENFLLNLERQLRSVFSTQVDGLGSGLNTVFDIGLEFNDEGVLSLDSTRFTSILDSDSDSVASLFTTANNGFSAIVDGLVDRYLGSTGLISTRTDSLNDSNNTLDERILDLNDRLSRVEDRLLRQFTALDTLIAQLNTSSSFLTQQLSSLTINQS